MRARNGARENGARKEGGAKSGGFLRWLKGRGGVKTPPERTRRRLAKRTAAPRSPRPVARSGRGSTRRARTSRAAVRVASPA